MKLETRHLKLESLSGLSRQIIEKWSRNIEVCLATWPVDRDCSRQIVNSLSIYFNLRFDENAYQWIMLLIRKWKMKTPDRGQQAESIAFAIFKQRQVK